MGEATDRRPLRRHGAMKAVALVAALVLVGLTYSAVVPNGAAGADGPQSQQIEQGRRLFAVGCASCHGLHAEGGTNGDGRQAGPSLIGVGAAAVDFQVSTGRMPAAQTGAQVPQKPPAYTAEEIAALSAYVASLGPGPAIPNPEDYSLEGMTEEERQAAIARGGQIFLTNCTACHNFEGSGGAMPRGGYAPKIRGAEPRVIYEALLTGPQAMPNFSNGNLPPESKRDVIAYLNSIDEAPNYGGFGLGGLGPVPEGLATWLVGIGLCVGAAVWIAAHTTRSNKKKADA